ncbi:hypothetical protein B296_00019707 [Ensete ventricosum]|uniref:Uncharacterized protein n=1 Tax=Ensete ventricosum TaxID=4639 RepID=A0A426Y7W9_ENSVE|nr:hypothetical protein B296_00019707 [Ensete ventricosum]
MPSYTSTAPAVLAVRDASTGEGCGHVDGPVVRKSDDVVTMSSCAISFSPPPRRRPSRANSTEHEPENWSGAGANLTEQELGNLNVARADPTEQELRNWDGTRADLTEYGLGNSNVARADPTEQELRN